MINTNSRKLPLLCILASFLGVVATSTYALIFGQLVSPSSANISLSKSGIVTDFKFEVKKNLPYVFFLKFAFPETDQAERERVRKLVGGHAVDKNGNLVEPGTSIPLSLKIFKVCKSNEEFEVYSQDSDPILTSWGLNNFTKSIGQHVLNPGFYRAQLTSKKSLPEFSSIPVYFEIGASAKTNFDPKKSPIRNEPCQQ